MRACLLLPACLCLFAFGLSAQNFVSNGDFAAGLTGWIETGTAINPGIETFDTTGLGPAPCYACNPSSAGNAIEQVIMVPPAPLEFTADFAVDRNPLVANADAGQFWVEVGTLEIVRLSLGGFVAGQPQRGRLTARFTHPTGGQLPLRINFYRGWGANVDTPRSRIDNITLRVAGGTTFDLVGNRKIGLSRTVRALAGPNEAVLFFIATGRLPGGLAIPGIGGAWFLDPTNLFPFFSGTTDATGVYSFALRLPSDPALTWAPVFVQGLRVGPGPTATLGHDQFLTFVP